MAKKIPNRPHTSTSRVWRRLSFLSQTNPLWHWLDKYCELFPLYRHGRNFDFSRTLNILCYELCRQGTEVTVHFWYIQIIALNLTKSSKAFNSSSIKSAYSESIRITRVNSLHWFCQVYGDNFNIYEKWKFIPNFCCPTLVQLTVIAKIWFLFLVCAFVRALDVQDIG